MSTLLYFVKRDELHAHVREMERQNYEMAHPPVPTATIHATATEIGYFDVTSEDRTDVDEFLFTWRLREIPGQRIS